MMIHGLDHLLLRVHFLSVLPELQFPAGERRFKHSLAPASARESVLSGYGERQATKGSRWCCGTVKAKTEL